MSWPITWTLAAIIALLGSILAQDVLLARFFVWIVVGCTAMAILSDWAYLVR